MSLQTGAPAPAVEVDAASQQLARGVKGGANWYFYIGALSLINSVLLLIGDESTFLVGLGITQVVDVLIQLLRPELSQSLGMVLVALGFVINLVLLGRDGPILVRRHPGVGLRRFAGGRVPSVCPGDAGAGLSGLAGAAGCRLASTARLPRRMC